MDELAFPKITIITPSYNQGDFIEETILSVIKQDYPNIEYIVTDGGSTDKTVDILRKYDDRISYWVSEPDKGQADAINKGLKKATGDIIAFINSDDYYEPGTFKFVAEEYKKGHHWIIGSVRNFRVETGESYIIQQKTNNQVFDWLLRVNENHQPGNFWSRKVLEQVGYMDEKLHYSFDWEYWVRFVVNKFEPVVHNDQVLANFRLHNDSKTVKYWRNFNQEFIEIINRYKLNLSLSEIKMADKEIRKLLVNEKIKFGRIESINGKFGNSISYFKEAYKISPAVIFSPNFLFEFFKAILYMPLRNKLG
ncbi:MULTISPECIES: glycosyltransferase family 2 protein [Niastella]|uniref:Glycosyltransferase n=1 Tax=Niastella soli TaxID=2821487 RepID=A0ABS3YQI0_9BACT|nr:glycosyltransferase family 2 protein [Niastella soli]MBO9200147.1 glycosyltransferase [Niastella soli]